MSILSRLAGVFRAKARDTAGASVPAGAAEAAPASASPAAVRASRRAERHARRELLHQVVRECMVRAGVLSSAYKFKVLALDQRGRQFLVMVDISDASAGHVHRLAEIEGLIVQAAKARHGIGVSAVYWRIGDAAASQPVPAARAVTAARPAPVDVPEWTKDSSPAHAGAAAVVAGTAAALAATAAAAGSAPTAGPDGFDPLGDDELAAFQQALDRAGAPSRPEGMADGPAAESAWPSTVPITPAGARTPGSGATAPPGYEDTELEDPDFHSDALGGTQYGSLN